MAAPEGAVHVVGGPGQVTQILQQGKKREEDGHGRQHDGDDPGGHAVHAPDRAVRHGFRQAGPGKQAKKARFQSGKKAA